MPNAAVIERKPHTPVKTADYATLYADDTILLKEVRVAYPHFDKPFKGDTDAGNGKFSAVFLMPKQKIYFPSKDIVRDEINRIIAANKLPGLAATNKFLKDGDLRPDKPEFLGNFLISASEVRPPQLRGRGKDPKTGKPVIIPKDEAAAIFYGGCWCNVLIRPWFQNNKFGKKVNANLLAVQFVRDDEAFGQGRISDEEIDESFGVIDDDDAGYDDGLGDNLDDLDL